MTYFPDKTLKRYTYTKKGVGAYGETITSYEYSNNLVVDFQNENNQEVANAYGVELDNLYKIYTSIETPLNDHDKLEDKEGNTYHIIGNIQEYSKFHKYKKAHLVLERSETS